MGFLQKIRQKMMSFMAGRYGTDRLNYIMVVTALVITVVGSLTRARMVTTILADVILVLAFYRMLSKDCARRAYENQLLMEKTRGIRKTISEWLERMKNRKKYHYYTCPNCHTRLRVPRGVGNITITCKSCGEKFDKKA